MINIVLYQPVIPPNTGNVMRLCANTNAKLHLIEPLGFDLSDKQVRRAGMDYRDMARVTRYADWAEFMTANQDARLFTLSTRHKHSYHQATFKPHDYLVFGSETHGLPDDVRDLPIPSQRLCLPMCDNNRSLNLSNSVAIVLYEAWRQVDFVGADNIEMD